MEKYGIDVSQYNTVKDWSFVKKNGFTFAIFKIITKDGNKDPKFDMHISGAEKAGIDIYGVYNYSYATNTVQALQDASCVIKALNGRKTMVWLDVEDKCQKNLKGKLIDIIEVYKDAIEKSGNGFGIYTGQSFYNSYLKPYYVRLKNIPMWIARYGKNNGMKEVKYQPQITDMKIWQYSSKGKVNGVSGVVDVNVCYDDKFLDRIGAQFIPASPTLIQQANPYPEPKRILKYKKPYMKGQDVMWVQFVLVQKGFMASKDEKGNTNIDGIYGEGTATAVRAFQKSMNISADSVVGQQTRAFLKKV